MVAPQQSSSIYGLVGGGTATSGAEAEIRLGRQQDIITNFGGPWYQAALSGYLYHAGTAATGVAPGTAIGTTAAFSLYNPIGSGVNLVVLSGRMGYVSGTLGAG